MISLSVNPQSSFLVFLFSFLVAFYMLMVSESFFCALNKNFLSAVVRRARCDITVTERVLVA